MANAPKRWKFDPRGAKCDTCKQHMLAADGCTICLLLLKDGTRVELRKYESGWNSGTGRCHDCGAKVGHYHHPGCDVEFRHALSCPRRFSDSDSFTGPV